MRGRGRIAFVVQRYGTEVCGGSELLCRLLVEQLSGDYDVEVLSTCALDHVTWRNHYPSGLCRVNGVAVRRFPIDRQRSQQGWAALCERVLRGPHSVDDEEDWMKEQGPCSAALVDFVARRHSDYDVFVFVTYLYATTYLCLPRVREKAVLIPTAHDERFIYLKIFDRVFSWPRQVLTLTPEETRFIQRRFGLPPQKVHLIGSGVEDGAAQQSDPDWASFAARLPEDALTLVYVGRIEEAKGCKALVDDCRRYRKELPEHNLQLILIGKGHWTPPEEEFIHTAGFVSKAFKDLAMQRADIVVVPSAYESLSFVALEAWSLGRPVLVNGRSSVLKGHCRRSNGGLWYSDYWEFREALAWMAGHPAECQQLGNNGQVYVRRNYEWSVVKSRFTTVIDPLVQRRPE